MEAHYNVHNLQLLLAFLDRQEAIQFEGVGHAIGQRNVCFHKLNRGIISQPTLECHGGCCGEWGALEN